MIIIPDKLYKMKIISEKLYKMIIILEKLRKKTNQILFLKYISFI